MRSPRLCLSAKPHTLLWHVFLFLFYPLGILYNTMWPVRKHSWHGVGDRRRGDNGCSPIESRKSRTSQSVNDGIWRYPTTTLRTHVQTSPISWCHYEMSHGVTARFEGLFAPSDFGARGLGCERFSSHVWRSLDFVYIWCNWSCGGLVDVEGTFK